MLIAANRNIHHCEFFHQACVNEKVTEGILRYLLERFPNAAKGVGEEGRFPIHNICRNKNVTLGMVQLLIDAFPDSLRHETINGCTPLHYLCDHYFDKEIAVEILKLLLERYPESVRHTATDYGDLPIHLAASKQSLEFCRLLIEAFPGSERVSNGVDSLPFHEACALNAVATTKYLYQLYPDSINVADNNGWHPIHYVILGIKHRKNNPEAAIKMVQFLLDCNPDVVLQKRQDKLPLHWVCKYATNGNTPKLNAYLKILQILYDAYPEAIIGSNEVTSNIGSCCEEVQTYINAQLTYARQARNLRQMNTPPDEDGQLPLHKALRDNVTLGSIKLLVKGNPSAVSYADNKGRLPLHIACQYHDSAVVVDYLIGLDSTAFQATDFEHNTALHFACRGAKYDTISLLLEKYGGVSISKRNAHSQLPIHLLLESKEVSDREDTKYLESVYRLLRAYPETVIGVKEEFNLEIEQGSCLSPLAKRESLVRSENGLSILEQSRYIQNKQLIEYCV